MWIGGEEWRRASEAGFSGPGLQAWGPAAPVAHATDAEACIALVQRTGRDALSVDQVMQLHHQGQLRPLPGQGRQVLIIGSVPGYMDEVITVHAEIASVLGQRGAAVYAS
jgi:hypothetical protein